MKRLSLAQYISLTIATGMAIFLSFLVGLGFIFAGVTWFITRNDDEEDRVMATILTFFLGAMIHLYLLSLFTGV